MIKKLIFGNGKGNVPAHLYQPEAHAMCREGLTNFAPLLTSPRKVRGSLPADMLQALHEIEKQLDSGQWLPSIEVYETDGAFNVWVAYNGGEDAVALYTYRRDEVVFEEGDEVQVNVTRWLGQEHNGKPKWKDTQVIRRFPNGQYETMRGIYSGSAIRRKP